MANDGEEIEIEVPAFIELKDSSYVTNDLGAFSRATLPADQFIGNYKGKIRKNVNQIADQDYYWTIFSSRQVPLFYIDASDPRDSNWVRFIRSTPDRNKCNVVCMQQNQQINYFTVRDIKEGEELVAYLPETKKKKGKNKSKLDDIMSNSTFNQVSIKVPDKQSYKLQTGQRLDSDGSKKCAQTPRLDSIEEGESVSNNRDIDATCQIAVKESASGSTTTNGATRGNKNASAAPLNQVKSELQTRNKNGSSNKSVGSTVVKFELMSKDTNDENLYTIDFNLVLKKTASTSPTTLTLKRQLIKCDMCTYAVIIDSTSCSINESLGLIKNHVANKHLTGEFNEENESSSDDNQIIQSMLDVMVRKVEANSLNMFYFRCCMNSNKCGQTFCSKQALKKHLEKSHATQIEKITCAYCGRLFNCITNRQISDFFDHLKIDHSELVKETQLDSIAEIEINNQLELEEMLNWNEYFGTGGEQSESESEETQDEPDETNRVANNDKNNSNEEEDEDLNSGAGDENEEFDEGKTKVFTCQMCKRQFEQRCDLNKHYCLEQALKLMRKKKEIRKKKWREAHWKRKIDLSYIESTSLTQVSRNIADNLSFCIDGTNEDLRAYSREVKDYLSSELGQETEIEMLVKCCFNDLYPSFTSNTHPNLDSAVRARANNYFLNNSHSNDGRLACRQCKIKFVKPSDLLQHNRYVHKMSINTTFDFFQHTSMDIDDTEPMANTPINISPIGYLGCDPTAYLLNMFWDKEMRKKCSQCGNTYSRPVFKSHVCKTSDDKSDAVSQLDNDESINREELKEDKRVNNIVSRVLTEILDQIESEFNSVEEELEPKEKKIKQEPMSDERDQAIEIKEESNSHESAEKTGRGRRTKRSALELLEGQLGHNNIIESKKRHIGSSTTVMSRSNSLITASQSSASLRSNTSSSESKQTSTRSSPIKKEPEVFETSKSRTLKTNKSFSIENFGKVEKYAGNGKATLITVRTLSNNRKLYICEKCGLEFSAPNSVVRHQEKSCLRVKVINVAPSRSNPDMIKKKCPICSSTFTTTHRLSIHIIKHHKNLLGSVHKMPSSEAVRLNEMQLKKLSEDPADDDEEDEHGDDETEEIIEDENEDAEESSATANSILSEESASTSSQRQSSSLGLI